MSKESRGNCDQFSPRESYTVWWRRGDMECAIGWPKRYPWRSTLEVSGNFAPIAILKICIVSVRSSSNLQIEFESCC